MISYDNRIHVWTGDLKDLWSGPSPSVTLHEVLPACAGQPGAVIIDPALGLDGASGHPRWAGQPVLTQWRDPFKAVLLDDRQSAREPLMISHGLGTTVCRLALATDPKGAYDSAHGTPVPPGLARDDPRWTRPLPWTNVIDRAAVRTGVLALVGLALINAALPLGILRLAASGRPWTLRALMMLPIAAAVPMTAYVTLEPLIPTLPSPYPASPIRVFASAPSPGSRSWRSRLRPAGAWPAGGGDPWRCSPARRSSRPSPSGQPGSGSTYGRCRRSSITAFPAGTSSSFRRICRGCARLDGLGDERDASLCNADVRRKTDATSRCRATAG